MTVGGQPIRSLTSTARAAHASSIEELTISTGSPPPGTPTSRRSRSASGSRQTRIVTTHVRGSATPATVTPPTSSIRLLDGFEAAVDGRTIDLAAPTQRLLALLALRERPQARTAVAGTLWIDRPEDRAAASLRTALWKLGTTGRCLVTMRGNLLAVADDVSVDFRVVVSQARALIGRRDDDATAHTGITQAIDTFVGDLLPDWDEDWILFERERLRQLRLHAIEALSRRFIAAGRYAEAVDAGLAAVAADALRESAHRVLIEAFLGEGNIAEARRQFNRFRAVLWDNLRLRPSPSLAGLVGA